MRRSHHFNLAIAFLLLNGVVSAQHAPSIGYMYPPGGAAGTTVDVVLGGYDWTPDTQVFVHDSRIQLEVVGPPGPVLVPEPPYWFGKKARRGASPLPRETPARLTIPADVEPGIVCWQAANVNGSTACGKFIVGRGLHLREVAQRSQPQQLDQLPLHIWGQIRKVAEVDRFQFSLEKPGPVTCQLATRAVGSGLNATVEVRDQQGQLVSDVADTAGRDVEFTFAVKANEVYTVSLFDVDFRGHWSYAYRLSLTPGPRVVASLPAAGQRGKTQKTRLWGYGIATGSASLESVSQEIAFPAETAGGRLDYRLNTSFGSSPPFALPLSDIPELVESTDDELSGILEVPSATTGTIEQRYGADRYRCRGSAGDVWKISVMAASIGSPLDVVLTVLNATGEQVAHCDDTATTTDAALEFSLPEDGEYELVVSDLVGLGGSTAAVYRLVVENAAPDFTLSCPDRLNLPLGGKAKFKITATRHAGHQQEIPVRLEGMSPDVIVPESLVIAGDQSELEVELELPEDSSTNASLVHVVAGSGDEDSPVSRNKSCPMLVAPTMVPPFSIDAGGKDDVTKWPRGTTFPAPVLIEREAGFEGEIRLEMTSQQGRVRQGIRGPDIMVPPGAERVLYPVFLPEWLETSRTSRMVVNGVAKVTDPRGQTRYSLSKQKTRMGFLPVGALLKLTAEGQEFQVGAGEQLAVPLNIHRTPQLDEPVRLELRHDESGSSFASDIAVVPPGNNKATFSVTANADIQPGDYEPTVRATAMKDGKLAVVSETTIFVRVPE